MKVSYWFLIYFNIFLCEIFHDSRTDVREENIATIWGKKTNNDIDLFNISIFLQDLFEFFVYFDLHIDLTNSKFHIQFEMHTQNNLTDAFDYD